MTQTDLFDARTAWYQIQTRAHDLAELVAQTPTPVRGQVDRYLADRLAVVANYIDRILRPLEVADDADADAT